MTLKDPQYDLPPNVGGASDVWDFDQPAGVILTDEYFESSAGPDAVSQTARFDNAQSFFSGAVTTTRTVSQSARFNNAQAFFGGSVSQTVPAQSVTQSALFGNQQQFFGGAVSGGDTQQIGGHYAEFWNNQWRKMAEREKRKEVVEELEEELEEIEQEIAEVKATPIPPMLPQIPIPPIMAQAAILERLIAQAAAIRAEIAEEEDILMLL